MKLDHVLCYQEPRVVQNDWTMSWCHRIFQWGIEHQKLSLARQNIRVSELLEGRIRLNSGGRSLSWIEVTTRPSQAKAKPKAPAKDQTPYKPAVTHPWRRPFR